jgi:hypothetical protein
MRRSCAFENDVSESICDSDFRHQSPYVWLVLTLPRPSPIPNHDPRLSDSPLQQDIVVLKDNLIFCKA